MPYSDLETKRIRQAEAARRRRAQGRTRDDGTTRDDAGTTRRPVVPAASSTAPEPGGENQLTNPVTALRSKLGLSRPAFAVAIGTTYNQVSAVECGYQRSIPSKWWAPLTRLGVDFDKLESEFEVWHRKRATALQAAVRGVYHGH